MSRTARLLVMWLLAAATSLQGVAAFGMTLCQSDGGSRSVLATVAQGDEPAASVEQHHQHATMGGMATSTPKRGHDGHDRKSAAKCSACASCCTSAALLPFSFLPDVVAPTPFYEPLGSIGRLPFLTTGQERPPKPILA